MKKTITAELEHGATIEDARKRVTEEMKKRKVKGKIVSIAKNNWLSFTRDGSNYYFDVEVETGG